MIRSLTHRSCLPLRTENPAGMWGDLASECRRTCSDMFREFRLKRTGNHLLLASVLVVLGSDAHAVQTWCNPLPVPDYPVGVLARTIKNDEPTQSPLWLLGKKQQFRELADPSALWLDGKWYLFPSGDMAWVSEDQGATWTHHPINVRHLGYAPTVVQHRGKFYLMGSENPEKENPLYIADSPLGPYRLLGQIILPQKAGNLPVPSLGDPMLFSDGGRLYLYWGSTPSRGIWVAKLKADDPTQLDGEPHEAIPFDPVRHPWEAVGEKNQNPGQGWLEGAWMLKHRGTYYLTYAAAGTQYRSYAMGCYTSKSPTGPFTPQKRNPILLSRDGLISGTAHGCVVEGPENGLWCFYTIRAGVVHWFERRLGMDRAFIDQNGELGIGSASSTPQRFHQAGPTGWLAINCAVPAVASSCAPNLPALLAVDDQIQTSWQPAPEDRAPVLACRFLGPATIHAVRIIWRDIGLDVAAGVLPGPFRYRVEIETKPGEWTVAVDRSDSREDFLVDYRECAPLTGTSARLVILGWPAGITPAVADFTVFGTSINSP